MSSIYVYEPATFGKVCLKTTVGDIDVELWSKECPKACRNFVQLCMEGYYNETIFHRVVSGFIAQGGDPNGDGTGGESIYGAPFKDEFHQRLKFTRRGLVAMANAGKDDNGSQFFFTLDACPELNKKHTIFAKVEGNTLFNMIKLGEAEVGDEDKPLYPQKITGAEVLKNPFPDIVPRISKQERSMSPSERTSNQKLSTKNLNLLSFGEEAEEEEELEEPLPKKKMKSAHDILKDDTLSDLPAITPDEMFQKAVDTAANNSLEVIEKDSKTLENVRSKLQSKAGPRTAGTIKPTDDESMDTEMDEVQAELWEDEKRAKAKKLQELRNEVKDLKRSLKPSKAEDEEDEQHDDDVSNVVKEYESERDSYLERSKNMPGRKSNAREKQTLSMMANFRSRIEAAKQKRDELGNNSGSDGQDEDSTKPKAKLPMEAGVPMTGRESENVQRKDDRGNSSTGLWLNDSDLDIEDEDDDDWISHRFKAAKSELKVVGDTTAKTDDQYDIHDPRNAMNQRRRDEASKQDRVNKRKV